MKKIALIIAGMTGFVSAEAHKGFSLGANVGYGMMDSKNTLKSNAATPRNSEYDLSGRGVVGGLGLGYFVAMNNLNLGLQLQGNMSTVEGQNEQKVPVANAYSLKVKQKWEANLCGRLGVNMNGAVPYLRAGASISEFEATAKSDLVDNKPSQTTKKQLVGVVAGAGVDVAVNDRVAVGADFRATFYPGFDAKQQGTTLTYTHNVKPTTMVGSVGVKYFF